MFLLYFQIPAVILAFLIRKRDIEQCLDLCCNRCRSSSVGAASERNEPAKEQKAQWREGSRLRDMLQSPTKKDEHKGWCKILHLLIVHFDVYHIISFEDYLSHSWRNRHIYTLFNCVCVQNLIKLHVCYNFPTMFVNKSKITYFDC